jgi:hypothetical protein
VSRTSNAILWVGLFLIAMIIVAHWAEIRKLIFTPEKTITNNSGQGVSTNWINWVRSHILHVWHYPGSPLPMP